MAWEVERPPGPPHTNRRSKANNAIAKRGGSGGLSVWGQGSGFPKCTERGCVAIYGTTGKCEGRK